MVGRWGFINFFSFITINYHHLCTAVSSTDVLNSVFLFSHQETQFIFSVKAKITAENSPIMPVPDVYPADLYRGFTFKSDVLIAGTECSFLEEQVLDDTFNTSEAAGGIHINIIKI